MDEKLCKLQRYLQVGLLVILIYKEQRSIDMNSLNCFSLLKDLEELSVDAELVEDRLVEFDEIYLLSCYPSMEPA